MIEIAGDLSTFAESDLIAERRFSNARNTDPFPIIFPALLNSADISDYVRVTGMLHPFRPEALKPASYPVRIGDRLVYWTGEGQRVDRRLGEGEVFDIGENSIVFVNTFEKFRLPSYIAIRFNLHIEFVHKGLLLGTGPLVDPGFEGHLLIPLHNLTTNTYTFRQGEELIWVEFTKVSPHPRWDSNVTSQRQAINLIGEYVPFAERKKNQQPEGYLYKAMRREVEGEWITYDSIRSSIPKAVAAGEQSARDAAQSSAAAKTEAIAAREQVEKVTRLYRNLGIGAAVLAIPALAISAFALYLDIQSLATAASQATGDVRVTVSEISARLEKLEADINEQTKSTGSLSKRVGEAESAKAAIERELKILQRRLDSLDATNSDP